MASGHEQHGAAASHHGPRVLPAVLDSPGLVKVWRTRALIVGVLFTAISLLAFSWTSEGRDHILRAYLLGFMTCFGFAGGGLVLLMLQYVSGGKWGLLLRRPLEAMTRTLPLVALMIVPVLIFMKHLYQWARFSNPAETAQAVLEHKATLEQALTMNAKRAMLSPVAMIVQTVIIFSILLLFSTLLNKWSVERDADPARGTEASYEKWRTRFENLSGIGILIYVIVLTDASILWIMSMDVTWYSSIWGFQFLVGQGFAVLALGILTVVRLLADSLLPAALAGPEAQQEADDGAVLLHDLCATVGYVLADRAELPERGGQSAPERQSRPARVPHGSRGGACVLGGVLSDAVERAAVDQCERSSS
jgi:hypothetical protein